MTRLQIQHRQPFALTDQQFRDLAGMTAGRREVYLGVLAHAVEWENHRRDLKDGDPWLMAPHEELNFAIHHWPARHDEKLAEARREYARMAADQCEAA